MQHSIPSCAAQGPSDHTTDSRIYACTEHAEGWAGQARLVVAAAAVADHLNAGQRERDVRRGRREELLARLSRQHRVLTPQRRVADQAAGLAGRRA